jgi:hypothetical protein
VFVGDWGWNFLMATFFCSNSQWNEGCKFFSTFYRFYYDYKLLKVVFLL